MSLLRPSFLPTAAAAALVSILWGFLGRAAAGRGHCARFVQRPRSPVNERVCAEGSSAPPLPPEVERARLSSRVWKENRDVLYVPG